MTSELAKTFDPAEIERKWYAHWESEGLFRPHRPEAEPFTLVNPPPNVTGSLHIGHALDNTLQDVVVRYERLRGKDALWVVGTDHAGIATQMVVERQMEQHQDKRTNYTREEFVEKVWEWKAESGGTITRQLRRLGCSMDWSREQFTMDPHFTKAVVKVFVDLYNAKGPDGKSLIYRDKRLVNWDPKLKTAISDLEVETQDVKGGFWHFRYPLADGVTLDSGADHIVVATTRPETMLADMAVAVNADDPRYRSVIGKDILQPLTGRRFKVIADEHADPELGSGAVKITPGHDFNDFEVGKRAGIAPGAMLNMFDAEAKVVQTADGLVPEEFLGLDRFDARKLVVERMKELGFLVPYVDKDGAEHDAEPRTVATPFGDRGGVVIEPWLTDQWYVNAEVLAQPAIEAVRSGAIEIVPKSWEKTFFNWMENIQPWCVSRQLWWGHRVPAWYATKREGDHESEHDTSRVPFVAKDETELRSLLDEYYKGEEYAIFDSEGDWLKAGPSLELRNSVIRDQDVLDTWFSSALWPFATLGWPESSPSSDGEGDQPQAGGGVRYQLPPKTNEAVLRAKTMRRAMPPSETTLWVALKERPGGFKFRRQHPAGDYVLDFFCPSAALAIEVDGEAHDRGNRPDRDAVRDAYLRECGIETLRVPAEEVFRDLEAVVAQIVERARDRTPLHQPAAGPPPRQAGEDSLLHRHYPNDLLISGFDILFFWDARMAMQGIHFMHDVPWRRLYLHGLVRAADGQKMSKSKGNVVDPLGLIDQYGADALRFFMAAMESQGRDIKMDESRVEGYRNFATKLWNATRFCQANGIGASTSLEAPEATLAVNKWIVGEVIETLAALDKAMAELRFDAAANAIYHFVWDRFCDWYLELIKPVLSKVEGLAPSEKPSPLKGRGLGEGAISPRDAAVEDSPHPNPSPEGEGLGAAETRAVAGWVLDQILVMLHPFMPFVTEELWHALGEREGDLIVAKWPQPNAEVDTDAKADTEWLIELVTSIRSSRNEVGVPPSAKLALKIRAAATHNWAAEIVRKNRLILERMGRVANMEMVAFPDDDFSAANSWEAAATTVGEEIKKGSLFISISKFEGFIPLEGVIDIEAEKARLAKSLEAARKEAASLAGRLANPAFVERAKPEAVDKARADHAHHAAEVERLEAALKRLG